MTGGLEALTPGLGAILDSYEKAWCPENADAPVHRVARRFALVCAGGEMAKNLEVLPEELNIRGAVKSCFDDWLTERGSAGAAEDAAILSDVRRFIEQHGASRFQDVDKPDAVCINRVGFRREGEGGFKTEVIKGYAPKRATEVLRRAGWLRESAGKSMIACRLPVLGVKKAYVLSLPDD